MIPHKCTPYCNADEGLHCVPMMGDETVTLEVARLHFEMNGNSVVVEKILRDYDVTASIVDSGFTKAIDESRIWRINRSADHKIGYLIWLRDRDEAHEVKPLI